MRAVAQRVSRAAVSVDGDVVGSIGAGLVALVGITHDDSREAAARMASKIANLRLMADEEGVMNRSVLETGGEVLVVSQFTLYGDTRKGRRPSWRDAAPPAQAEALVDAVTSELAQLGVGVATGRFGADMDIELVNDGPVTVIIET